MQSPKNKLIRGKEFSVAGAFQAASVHLVNEPAFATFRMQSPKNRLIRGKEFSVDLVNEPAFATFRVPF